jgi:hypothetical protein
MLRMPMIRTFAVVVLAAVPAIAALGTRQPTTRVLERPQAELPEPFTVIGTVRELGDGRVIVVDSGDRLLYVVDLLARSASQIGRQGGGPAEYRVPGTLLPLAGDTTLLTDAGNRRLLALGPDATPVAVISDAWPMPGGEPGTRLPRGIDGRGRGYLQGSAARVSASGAVTPLDSAPLLRVARGSATDDTLGYVHLAPRRISTTSKNGALTSVDITIPPYPAQDGWQAFADGAVAIARVREYRVDWVLPDGRRVAGPEISHSPVRVGQRDKDEWSASAGRVRAAAAGSPAPSAAPRPEPDWPEFKPPFPSAGVLAGSDGRLWVQRHSVAGDTRSRYDVIDRRGVVVQRVEIPGGGRVVGFGPRSIYVARKDADDLQYLQRFAMGV